MSGTSSIEVKNYLDIETETYVDSSDDSIVIIENNRRVCLLAISITAFLINLGFSIAIFVEIHNEPYKSEWKVALILILISRILLSVSIIRTARIKDDPCTWIMVGVLLVIYTTLCVAFAMDYWFSDTENTMNDNKIIFAEVIIDTGIATICGICAAIGLGGSALYFLTWLFGFIA